MMSPCSSDRVAVAYLISIFSLNLDVEGNRPNLAVPIAELNASPHLPDFRTVQHFHALMIANSFDLRLPWNILPAS